jgi:hypothetical protein
VFNAMCRSLPPLARLLAITTLVSTSAISAAGFSEEPFGRDTVRAAVAACRSDPDDRRSRFRRLTHPGASV